MYVSPVFHPPQWVTPFRMMSWKARLWTPCGALRWFGLPHSRSWGGNDRVASRTGQFGRKGVLADAGRTHEP